MLRFGKISSWDERSKYSKKLQKVFDALGIKVEEDKRPLSSMARMKTLRNTLAHGKPVEFNADSEQEGTQEELRKGTSLAADWESEVKPEVVAEAVADLDQLWKLIKQKSGIDVIDTLSQGEMAITVIQKNK